MKRVYLDWNATAPLRKEAREAMISSLDIIGNPSSVHFEGRLVKGLIEKARLQLSESFSCDPNGIIWTSGATEAASLMMHNKRLNCSDIEHECVKSHGISNLIVNSDGIVEKADEFVPSGCQ